jgi:hypothetical protein
MTRKMAKLLADKLWESAKPNPQGIIDHEISRLEHAISDWRSHPTAYPILAKHGYLERTANGYMAISPEAVVLRCRELIAKLKSS